jgi:carbohydrate kinase (thermoresistant glucokinase family)
MSESLRIVVMGVSGVGKSTVGAALAERLGVPFADADPLHPEANVTKMSAGIPLVDDDRWPWLSVVGRAIAESADGIVMACSALRRSYRDAIRAEAPGTVFVLLSLDRSALDYRVSHRVDHFMPPTLLDSQLETLEPLDVDEIGVTVIADKEVDSIVQQVVDLLHASL